MVQSLTNVHGFRQEFEQEVYTGMLLKVQALWPYTWKSRPA